MSLQTPGPRTDSPRDAQTLMRYDANKKSLLVAYLLWFVLGCFGAHRFYLGRIASAIVMLLLWLVGWGLVLVIVGYVVILIVGIWVIVDAFLIPGMVRDMNNKLIDQILR